jgi:O-antigen ligase
MKLKFAGTSGVQALFYLSLLYFAVLMPWQLKWLPISLGMMLAGLFWLISADFKAKLTRLSANNYVALFFSLYLLLVIGAIYSSRPTEAAEELLLKVPFIVWPLLLATIGGLKKQSIDYLFKVFITSNLLMLIVSLLFAVYRYLDGAHGEVFYFAELLSLVLVPPHYMGLYLSFSYAILLHRFMHNRPIYHTKLINLAALLLLFAGIILLSVRMQYLVFVVINTVILNAFLRKRIGQLKSIFSIAGFAGVFFSLLLLFPGSRSRLIDTYNETRSFEGMVENKQTNPRKFLWLSGLDVISENFWFGVGTGSEDIALNNKLEKIDAIFWDGRQTYQLYEMRYNYHSTYLQTFAANGVFAFIILITLFVYPLFKIRHHPYRSEAGFFLLICVLSFATESMLQRQAGVVFFGFFYSVFFIMMTKSEKALSGVKKSKLANEGEG